MPGLAEEGGCDEAGRSFRCAFLPVFLSLCLRWRSGWNPMDGNIKGSPLCGGTALDVFVQFLSRCQEGGFVPVWKRLS